jgi:hypothetical protein
VEYLKKGMMGFVFGIGFSLAVVLVLFIANRVLERNLETAEIAEPSQENVVVMPQKKNWASEFSIEDKGMTFSSFGPEFMATLTNNSEKNATWVFVKTDLFNEAGDFIYQCESSENQLAPGTSRNIKIRCNLSGHPSAREIGDAISSHKTFVGDVH